jgi:hypothetical protein
MVKMTTMRKIAKIARQSQRYRFAVTLSRKFDDRDERRHYDHATMIAIRCQDLYRRYLHNKLYIRCISSDRPSGLMVPLSISE